MSELTRRQFCVVTGVGMTVGACGGGSEQTGEDMASPILDLTAPPPDLSSDPNCPVGVTTLNAGAASALEVGKVHFFSCAKLFVLRDTMGIYAMTAVCTHQGCTVMYAAANQGFACPCHMSTYNLNGAVTNPPAMKPLQHFACSLDGSDNVIVALDSPVAASTRLTISD